MHTFLAILLPYLLLVPGALTVNHDFEKLYFADFSKDTDGGCLKYKQKILDSYEQAYQMVDRAITALEDLQKEKPPKDSINEYNEWNRKSRVYKAMYAKSPRKDTAGLAEVLAHFESIKSSNTRQDGDEVGFDMDRHTRYYLFCNDDWVKYLKPEDNDPTTPGKKIGDDPRWAESGALWSPILTEGYQFIDLKDKRLKISHQLQCTKTELAWSLRLNERNLYVITFCSNSLDEPVWSTDQHQPVIGDRIDQETVLATTWVHEWGHVAHELLESWEDWPRYYRGCIKSKTELTYGWSPCVRLAKCDKELALISPENYCYFAYAMFYDKLWWGTGKAAGPPKKVKGG